KQILPMKAVKGEGFAQKKRLGKQRAQGEQEFVRFDDQGFGNRANAAQKFRAKSHATGAQETLAKPKKARVSRGIQTEAWRSAEQFAALAAVGEHFRNAVADEANGGIGGKGLRDRGEFAGRPPIVAIEEGDDFPLAERDTGIERGGLAAIHFA